MQAACARGRFQASPCEAATASQRRLENVAARVRRLRNAHARRQSLFDALDQNGDGVLTRADLEKAGATRMESAARAFRAHEHREI